MKQYFISAIFLFVPLFAIAQSNKIPILEREISLSITNVPVSVALASISQKADFVFSYSPDAIDASSLVSLNIQQKPVRHILNIMFAGAVKYKEKGKYLILQKDILYAEKVKNSNQKRSIEGYITDSKTGQKIGDATVYNKELLTSANTDKYGYFKIELPHDKKNSELHISKQGFTDTMITKIPDSTNYVTFEMASKQKQKTNDSSENHSILRYNSFSNIRSSVSKWFISKKLWVSSLNINDTVFRKVQFSFLPFLSTNKFFTGNAANDYSINVIAGYTQEVRIVEFGGVQNIVRNNVRYGQFAGVGNIVGGSFTGFQAAGVYNITSKSFTGAQTAGVFNIAGKNVDGVQIAGVWNIARDSIQGCQVAGVFNTAKSLEGSQISGVLNIAKNDAGSCQVAGVTNIADGKFEGPQIAGVNNVSSSIDGTQIGGVVNTANEVSGVQIAGVLNVASKLDGVQIAEVMNYAHDCDGVQIAQVMNYADEFDGVQISCCLNKATFFKGFQISLLNLADSCKGTPIGLFSYVKNGYHKVDLSADEIFYSNITFRTGVKYFHNLIIAGIRPDNFIKPLWTVGYGLGTTFGNENSLLFDIDLSVQRISKGKFSLSANDLYKFYFGFDKKIFSNTSLAIGITYNLFISDTKASGYKSTFDNLAPYTLSNTTKSNGLNLKTWIGCKVALRFL